MRKHFVQFHWGMATVRGDLYTIIEELCIRKSNVGAPFAGIPVRHDTTVP